MLEFLSELTIELVGELIGELAGSGLEKIFGRKKRRARDASPPKVAKEYQNLPDALPGLTDSYKKEVFNRWN